MTVQAGRSGLEVASETAGAGGGPEQALSQTSVSGPPRPRVAKRDTTTVTVELTFDELAGLAWASIHVAPTNLRPDHTRGAESALRKLRAVVRPAAPRRTPYY